jgi:hypothetical protein
MAEQNVTDRDWSCLYQWLEKTYGSADPSRVLAFERKQLHMPGWRFFYGSLNVPSHGGAYAVAVHNEQVWQGEAGLVQFVKDKDVYGHPDALPVEELAAVAMFFLSHFGRRDAKLITDLAKERKAWDEKFSQLLYEPRMTPEDDGYVLQFWYLQRTLIRVTLHIRPNNEITYDKKVISELLPPE